MKNAVLFGAIFTLFLLFFLALVLDEGGNTVPGFKYTSIVFGLTVYFPAKKIAEHLLKP